MTTTTMARLQRLMLAAVLTGLCGAAGPAEGPAEPEAADASAPPPDSEPPSPHAVAISSTRGCNVWIATWSARRLLTLPRKERPDRELLQYLKDGPHLEVRKAILSGPHGTGLVWSLPGTEVESVLLDLLRDERLLARARRQLIVLYANERELDPSPLAEHLTESLAKAREPLDQARDVWDLVKLMGTLNVATENAALQAKVTRAVLPLLTEVARSPEHYVRYNVAALLGELPADQGLPLATRMLRDEESPDPTDKLLNTLHVYAARPLDRRQRDAIRGAALRVADDRGVKSYIRTDAIRVLVALGHDRLIGDLIGLLRTDGEPDGDVQGVSDGPRTLSSPDTEATVALAELTGRDFGFDPATPRERRAAAARRWVAWWQGD